ncbi:MAG: hypothetical protein Q9196_005252 [Gyalolechia fulgens]
MDSPALEAIKFTGHFQRFDGSFATPNAFKGTPNPNIDAAWANITYEDGIAFSRLNISSLTTAGGVINISEETLRSVNASAEFSVKLTPEIGGGYMASVEILHQLHCLNMLRQATYEDYYRDKAGPWKDSPQTLRYHLGMGSSYGYNENQLTDTQIIASTTCVKRYAYQRVSLAKVRCSVTTVNVRRGCGYLDLCLGQRSSDAFSRL